MTPEVISIPAHHAAPPCSPHTIKLAAPTASPCTRRRGERPFTAALASEFGVSKAEARAALDALAQTRLVEQVKGMTLLRNGQRPRRPTVDEVASELRVSKAQARAALDTLAGRDPATATARAGGPDG